MLPKDIKSSKVTKKWLAIIRSYVEAEHSTYISATSWCKQNNINYYMFIRWRGRFRNEGMLNPDDLESSAEVRSQSEAFVDVTSIVKESNLPDSGSDVNNNGSPTGIPSVMLQVNNIKIYVNSGIDADTLATVLQAVRNA
jgi:hypothetical protein